MKKIFTFIGDDLNSITKSLEEMICLKSKEIKLEKPEARTYKLTSLCDLETFFENESNLKLFPEKGFLKIFVGAKLLNELNTDAESFVSFLNNLSRNEYIFLVFSYDKFDKKQISKILLKLKSLSEIFEFQSLKFWQQDKIRDKILHAAKKHDLNFKSDALDLFLETIKNDTDKIEQEISKLSLYLLPQKDVSIDLIKQIYSLSFNMDDFFDFVIGYKPINILDFTEKYRDLSSSLYLLAVLQAKLREALKIKICIESNTPLKEVASLVNIHPYKLKLISEKIKNKSLNYLTKLVINLSSIEYKLKTGKTNDSSFIDLITLLPSFAYQ